MRKRHTQAEIAHLLNEAQEMALAGKSQSDIARALGISVMTYHRWRKVHGRNHAGSFRSAVRPAAPEAETQPIRELRVENLRLRRLVADLLLEKTSLQEALQRRGRSTAQSGLTRA